MANNDAFPPPSFNTTFQFGLFINVTWEVDPPAVSAVQHPAIYVEGNRK